MHVLHKPADLQRSAEVPECHRVNCQACQFVDSSSESEQVIFNCDVEGVRVFEIHGDGEEITDFGEGDESCVAEEVG